MSIGVTLMQGLDHRASAFVKEISAWEVATQTGSIWSPFLTSSAEPDPACIDEAYRIRFHMSDAYPAAYNDFSSLWGGLKALAPALKSAYNIAKPGIRAGLNSLPMGGWLNTGLDALEGVLERPGGPAPSTGRKRRTREKQAMEAKMFEMEHQPQVVRPQQQRQNQSRAAPPRPLQVQAVTSSGQGLSKGARKRRNRRARTGWSEMPF